MTHPHAEAAYRVVARPDGSFAVEMTAVDTNPAMISPFATAADAEAWISRHKEQIAAATVWSAAKVSPGGDHPSEVNARNQTRPDVRIPICAGPPICRSQLFAHVVS